jgi:hypothetical protein
MNAIEIEEAVTELASEPFNGDEFPYDFLRAFGNKDTTIKKLRSGASNKSDVGGVLQTNNIHIKVASIGQVNSCLNQLKQSPATTKAKARFIVATDGVDFEAEDLENGETRACSYEKFPDQFGFFLPLAGISTVAQIRESSFDIRATSRLNRLYVELLKDNPEWGTAERSHAMNHFMARLIFCFFAESTDIFSRKKLFIETVEQMSERDSSNTHEVIGEIFRAMDTDIDQRSTAKLPRWADAFPYVNGGLFSGDTDAPKFSRISRSYLLHIGGLDWTKINPDIFGSMIQAVADDEERGELGMHYTSVPNILKVLNPLFLDDLREKLEEAGDNSRMLLNLRKRIARIRVFDPACGSGNFLVIAYKRLREIENEINVRRGEEGRATEIPLTNFRGIEIRDFSCEIARLALVIAEYQCDLLYRGQKEALAVFLPLDSRNWITCGNALRIDWKSILFEGSGRVKIKSDDLFGTPLNQTEIDFENEIGETYVCGNPPYIGDKMQKPIHKADVEWVLGQQVDGWKSLDYVCSFFWKAANLASQSNTRCAFVTTKSITQGQQVSVFWPHLIELIEIEFAYRPFTWSNLASNNAGVTCVIIGFCGRLNSRNKILYTDDLKTNVLCISPYLTPGQEIIVQKVSKPINNLPLMKLGNVLKDDGHLQLTDQEVKVLQEQGAGKFIKRIIGSTEFIRGTVKHCLYISDKNLKVAMAYPLIADRLNANSAQRAKSRAPALRDLANLPNKYYFHLPGPSKHTIVVPRVTSENRDYLPVGFLEPSTLISDRNYGLVDAPIWVLSVIASRLHWVWIGTVCVRMRTDFSYSNTLGWNTFPTCPLTEKNVADLSECAKNILLAREKFFPANIADLYQPDSMPAELKAAHEINDEVLERIYIGRRFRNDTERLEKLFELYTKITTNKKSVKSHMGAGQ